MSYLTTESRIDCSDLLRQQFGPGRSRFVVGQAFGIQGFVSEMELYLHGLGQIGSWFLKKIVCMS